MMTRRLDIDSLRTLKFVAEHGGVTRASETLGISQSAVSHKLRRMEEAIDCTLLNRRAGAPLLTESGKCLLTYANRILNLHDEALMMLSKRTLTGKIRMGMTEDTVSDLASILGRFARLFPNVSVHTHISQSMVLEQEYEKGQIDIAVMQLFSSDLQDRDIVIYEDQLHWVISHDFQLNRELPIPLLTFDQNCFYKHWIMALEEQYFKTVLECPSNAGIVAAITSGMGVALLNERHITPEMKIIDDLFVAPPKISYIVRFNQKKHSSAVKALAKEITRGIDPANHLQVA